MINLKKQRDLDQKKAEKTKPRCQILLKNFMTIKAIRNIHSLSIFDVNSGYISEIEKLLNYTLLLERLKTTDTFTKIPKKNWMLEDDPEPTYHSEYVSEIKSFFLGLSTGNLFFNKKKKRLTLQR